MANVTYTVPNKNGSYDGDMVVKQYNSVTIDTGDTVTVDQPCRGLFILVKGDCTINGTLSMTARGAFANPTTSGGSDSNAVDSNGLRFPFLTSGGSSSLTAANTLLNGCGTEARSVISNFQTLSSNGTILIVTRDGGLGGAGKNTYSSSGSLPGDDGGTVTNGTGGGGAGMSYYYAQSQNGAKGSCFSGGSGSGGIRSFGNPGNRSNTSFPVDYGGAGGQGQYYGEFQNVSGGGAGNPGGTSTGTDTSGQNGTGGLIVLVVGGNLTVGSNGKIQANGMLAGGGNATYGTDMSGGASGGGRIIIAHRGTYSNSGTVEANGGTKSSGSGGNGGAGSVTVEQVN
jgi:hypothetical protein